METNEMKIEPVITGLVTNCHSYEACKSAGVVSCWGCTEFGPKNIQGVKK